MARTATYSAIVLKSQDIGEADRFCIVFTREAGRMAVRAKGVRRATSRLSGILLPYRHVRLEITETSSSTIVTGAQDLDIALSSIHNHNVVTRMSRGLEVLLLLTEDAEPLPEVFDLTKNFLRSCLEIQDNTVVTVYHLMLLDRLGFLPATTDDARFERMSDEAQAFISCISRVHNITALCAMTYPKEEIERFLQMLFAEQLPRALRA